MQILFQILQLAQCPARLLQLLLLSESITSKDFKTGYEYTVTGTGISHDGGSMGSYRS